MSNKSSTSMIATVTDQIDRVPEHMRAARKTVAGWSTQAAGVVRKNPARSVIGAFAIGFVMAKLARLV
jgi:hypothetical protein